MNYETVCEIYDIIEETAHELRFDLYRTSARYAALRTEWRLSPLEARHGMDTRRTLAHNAVIDALDILTRSLIKEGRDVSWRIKIGDDRKDIGDFAVFLSARLGILAR
jgi:hypothetical protein